MKSALLKYKVGLLVLLVLTVGLVMYVGMQASKAKADLKTTEAATKIADKLNVYTAQNGAPSSLAAAGIRDVPKEVAYTKLSDTKYRFCVTYRAESSGFNPDTVVQDAFTGYYMSRLGGDESSNYLFIKNSHKKGVNCQEIKVQSAQDSFFNFDTPSSSSTDSFDSTNLNQLYNSQTDPSAETLTPSYEFPVQ